MGLVVHDGRRVEREDVINDPHSIVLHEVWKLVRRVSCDRLVIAKTTASLNPEPTSFHLNRGCSWSMLHLLQIVGMGCIDVLHWPPAVAYGVHQVAAAVVQRVCLVKLVVSGGVAVRRSYRHEDIIRHRQVSAVLLLPGGSTLSSIYGCILAHGGSWALDASLDVLFCVEQRVICQRGARKLS